MKFSKLPQIYIVIFSSLAILFVLLFAFNYLAMHLQDDVNVGLSGRANMDFRVFYLDNDIFPDNPIPQNLHFIMAFTDFIEVDTGFSAQLSEYVEFYYSYTSIKRLVIRYIASADGGATVFESYYPLSNTRGSYSGREINLPTHTYTIYPGGYINLYLDFIEAKIQQMETGEGLTTHNARSFSAEVFIDFTYNIIVPDWGISESITRGYRVPLSSEVYTLVATGTTTFDNSANLNGSPTQATLPVIIFFVAIFAIGTFGLFVSIKKLTANPNKNQGQIDMIFKKYANEIVLSGMPLPLSQFLIFPVKDFDALLKVAIVLNKHIICFHNGEFAEFAVTAEGFAYHFKIGQI
ncbi:MAG: DUF5305 domain-containing protein [Defluviitaleaceae bacterium]|nr:DUF5305 domain-containing protein [Defluviitaleaceae bacterium]